MTKETLEVKKLENEVESLLRAYKLPLVDTNSSRGKVFVIKTEEATLHITIGSNWIGYDLSIDKNVLGRSIGNSEDTDIYPLNSENEKFYLEVFNNSIACFKALLEGRIYVGKIGRKFGLAIPLAKGGFKLLKVGRFIGSAKVMSEEELKKFNLRPIK